MEQRLREYVHIIPSWDAYPRVRFFYSNLRSLVPRFKRVAGALPLCFHNKKINEHLDDTLEAFSNGVRVTVFGDRDIDRGKFIISRTGQETSNEMIQPSMDVYICYVKVNGISSSNVTEVWAKLDQVIKEGGNINHDLFLYCEIPVDIPKYSVESFKSEILKQVQDHGIQLESTHITVGHPVENIAEQISNSMESRVVYSFDEIYNHLDSYVPKIRHAPYEMNLNETTIIKQISKQLKNILNESTLDDLTLTGDKLKTQQQTDQEEKRNQKILSAIPRVIKCLLVSILAETFSMSFNHCNDLICYLDFEQKLFDAMNESPTTTLDRELILHMLNQALPKFLTEIVSDLENTRRGVVQMRKMMYEVHNYLRQTNVSRRYIPRPTPTKLPEELKDELRSTKGVLGFGTFYGQIQIHIESSNEQSTKEIIRGLVEKYRFSYPYSIKHVRKTPTLMAFDLNPGNELIAHIPPFKDCEKRSGTLGGYIKDREEKVYGLTCAHVVGQTRTARVFVKKDNGPYPLSVKQYIFYGGSRTDCDHTFVDISATEVIASLQDGCKQYLRGNNSRTKLAEVRNDIPESMVGTKVSKIGAFTGKTYGIIESVDYELFGGNAAREYLMVIDILPGDVSNAEDNIPANDLHPTKCSVLFGTSSLRFFDHPKIGFTEQTGVNNMDSRLSGNEDNCPETSTSDTRALADANAPDDRLRVYIHDPYCWTGRSTNGVFSSRGDSGSIVCTETLAGHVSDLSALSMISAGEFRTNDGHDESNDKSLAFKLLVGLEKLNELHNIHW